MIAAAVLAALAAAVAVAAYHRDRPPAVPPVPRHVLEHYDDDGRRVDQ